MGQLPRNPLGRTGLDVSLLGLGTAPLGDLYARLDEAEAVGAIAHALDHGIGLIDTSPHYGNGLAEHRIGSALRAASAGRAVISTKIGRVMDPFREGARAAGFSGGLPHAAAFDYSADGVRRALEQSLLRLGVNQVDILLLHDIDIWTHGADFPARYREAMAGAMPALLRLRAEGVVKAVGIGVNEADIAERVAEEADIDCVLLAGRYSLLEQPALARFLPLAERRNIGVMLGGVFNSGILATGPVPGARYNYQPAPAHILEKVGRIAKICAAHETPLARASLHFAAAHKAVSSIVLGAVTRREIDQQIADLTAPVPRALFLALQQVGLLDPSAPIPGA